jgi:hypothetical protein
VLLPPDDLGAGIPGSIRRLLVDDLHCPIDPEASKILIKDNKIVVALKKEIESTWYRLRKGA